MSAKDALLFIDANKYLDLYRTDKGRKLLGPLAEQASYIFVTKQVVDEVERNKLGVAAEFLRTKSQGMKLHSINVPDHFSGSISGKNQEILRKMGEISRSVSTVNAEIDSHTLEIMTQVAESKDEVSKALAPIFSKAVQATLKELKRARERKEVGNPPGKRNDPLGDEISWEQILSHFEGKRRLWIISRDGDYGTAFGGTLFLNGLLKSELVRIEENASVYIFKDLVEGLTHFVETTKVKAKLKLTPEEVTEIEVEEKSLPPMDSTRHTSFLSETAWSGANVDIQKTLAAMQPSIDLKKTIAAMQPSIDLQKTIAAMQPSIDLQKTIAAMQPSIDLQKTLAAMQPSIDIQKTLAAMQPSIDLQETIAAIQPSIDIQKALDVMQPSTNKSKGENE
ncbi:PIN domain-containing protein [Thalassolituus maritimus]|uniref:PIN like domain-containing protein n=1 Tax=Thalassolituus maritimus TaxID=484498 RepID=A0ABQ0A0V1_9GAMM